MKGKRGAAPKEGEKAREEERKEGDREGPHGV